MSLHNIIQYLPQEIQKVVKKTDEKEWAKKLLKEDKKGSSITKLYKQMVLHAPFQENAKAKEILEKTKELIQKHKKEFSKKAQERYKKAHELYQQKIAPTKPKAESKDELYTATLKKRKDTKSLREIIKDWEKKAEKKEDKAEAAYQEGDLTYTLFDKAVDCHDVIDILKDDLRKVNSDERVVIAYNKAKKVQGMALVSLSSGSGTEIELIAAHPKNVVIFGNEQATRGAGTAIIKHVVHDILTKTRKGDLHLGALDSAIPFYEKIGMQKKGTPKPDELQKMVLKKSAMKGFLEKHKEIGNIKQKAPKAKELL
jgi:hypothetical protein